MQNLVNEQNHAKPSNLKLGDTVLVKQDKRDSFDIPFKPTPYEVSDMNGTMITAENDEHKITRNSSCFKNVSPHCGGEMSSDVPGELSSDSEMSSHSEISESGSVKHPVVEPRRSGRIKSTPQHLEDFVLK